MGSSIATRKQDNQAIAAAGHEKLFAPAKQPPKNFKPPYEHLSDRVHIVKNFKDEEGNVMVAPRNIVTNPIKVGKVGKQTSLGGVIKH